MAMKRRSILVASGWGLAVLTMDACSITTGKRDMFGLIGKITAKPGKGLELSQILKAGSAGMPGNEAYLIALDDENTDEIWIHEVWESAAAHKASLELASVQEAIAQGRPLIENFDMSRRVRPVT